MNKKSSQYLLTTLVMTVNKELVLVFYLLSVILITLLVSHQQLIVGTVVNSLLFFTSYKLSEKSYLPIAVFPSIVAVFQGLLFGKLTIFLIYFLPFIWLGNYFLMIISKRLSWLIGIIVKVLFLFLIANLLVNLKIVPKIFLTSMGLFQLVTAVLGYSLYLLISKLFKIK